MSHDLLENVPSSDRMILNPPRNRSSSNFHVSRTIINVANTKNSARSRGRAPLERLPTVKGRVRKMRTSFPGRYDGRYGGYHCTGQRQPITGVMTVRYDHIICGNKAHQHSARQYLRTPPDGGSSRPGLIDCHFWWVCWQPCFTVPTEQLSSEC